MKKQCSWVMCISLMEIAWVTILRHFSIIVRVFPPYDEKINCITAELRVANCVGEPKLLTIDGSWTKHHWQQWDQMPCLEKGGKICFRNLKSF